MEEVTFKTYCRGHDHCAAVRRREAEREAEAKAGRGSMELDHEAGDLSKAKLASSSGASKGKRSKKGKSLAQAILEQKALEDIIKNKDKEMRLKQKEELESAMLLGKKREEAMEKLKENQKRYALDAITNDLGLPLGEMWPFMYSDSEDGKDVYEDLADIEEGLELVEKVSDRKKKKIIEEVNLGE